MKIKYSVLWAVVVGLFVSSPHLSGQSSQSVSLAWNASPSSNVVGYVVHYGGTSGTYSNATNVNNQLTATVAGLGFGQNYFFAVTARDSAGVESLPSNEISYQTPPALLPVVALTSPVSGAAFTAPAAISLAASVTANGHTITKVQFYNGTTLLGEDASSPYSYAWNSVIAGNYSLTARAVYDSGSTVASSLINVVVTTSLLPTVALTSPVNGATLTAPAAINCAASVTANGHTITKVQFYNGTTLLGEDASSPYSYAWNSVIAGNYSLTARVVYDAGSTVVSALINVVVTTTSLPTVALTSPVSGAALTAPAAINCAASVAANGHTITKVQFYNGTTLLGEDTTSPYSLAWNNVNAGSYSLTARAVYDSGSTVASSPVSITVASASAVTTIWPSTAVPVVVDGGADSSVELGVKFRSDIAGTISGIRFYKATANTGTHVGNLWSSTGTLLASATFTGETASGWQQVSFATPVAIAANTVYVASYHANNGHYSADINYFTSKGVDNPPLHALTNGVSGGNGVYAYGASSTVPTQTWNAANYWVDVVFQAGVVAGLPAPWQTANIGTGALAGNASASSGVYTVQGAGAIAGAADSFRFVYQPLNADGEITARINSMTTAGANRRAGVMIRESLTPGSKYAFMGIGQDLKFRWQRRSNTSGSTSTTASVLSTPPNVWTRLVRTSNTLYGYSSTNGVNWTQVNSRSITMAANIYVGFVVASGSTNTLNTSVFSNVSVTP